MKTPNRFIHTIDRGTYSEKWEVYSYTAFNSTVEKWYANHAGVALSRFSSAESIINVLNTRPALNWRKDNKIKVVGADLMCFPVDAETLKPLSCAKYDPYALIDKEKEYIETIGIGEYHRRLNFNKY